MELRWSLGRVNISMSSQVDLLTIDDAISAVQQYFDGLKDGGDGMITRIFILPQLGSYPLVNIQKAIENDHL